MASITQVKVSNQNLSPNGHETCGYHSFKNSLLKLMQFQGLITIAQFQVLVKDDNLYNAIFSATRLAHPNGNLDVTLPYFSELLDRAQNGAFDFSRYGMSQEQLKKLQLAPGSSQSISLANYSLTPNSPEHGLGGMEEDLLVAAATAALARAQGKTHHVFALGINNAHWLTAAVSQDERGYRCWEIMDSYNNQSTYNTSVVNKIEAVLQKTEPELRLYLQNAYNNSSTLFLDRYELFFDDSGLPLAKKVDLKGNGRLIGVKEYFIDQKLTMKQFATWINVRFQFMEMAGWLVSRDGMEELWLKQLYYLTDFLLKNASIDHPLDSLVMAQLGPIHERLHSIVQPSSSSLAELIVPETDLNLTDDLTLSTTVSESSNPSSEINPDLLLQQATAVDAVNNGTPKPTEGFTARLVRAIKSILEGIKNAFVSLKHHLGLVN